ncbi:MAG: transporter substrate-binding domain-containing protein [Burkholderiales bacterium]
MKSLKNTHLTRAATTLACLGTLLGLLAVENVGARTLAEVKSLGAISVCANGDALPYASNKPDSPGFQIEIARAIAAGLGVSLNIEWILPRRRANVVNCDMLMDSINDPAVHEGRMLLSRPYQKSGLALGLARDAEPVRDFKDLRKDQKIGAMVSSVANMVLIKAGKTTSPYAFQTDMLEDLAKGAIYGAAVSGASMSYYILQHPDSGLKLSNAFDSEPQLTWEVSVGLRKSDQALVDAVNPILDSLIASGILTAIYAKYGVQHRVP